MTDGEIMTVRSLANSLDSFPQHLPVVVEGPVNQDGRVEIDDIMVAITADGQEEVHLITRRK